MSEDVQSNDLVLAFRAFEASYEHLPIVFVNADDSSVNSDGKEMERVRERQAHRLLYRDAYVALTTYEICYGLWSARYGSLLHGNLWGPEDKLDLSTLPTTPKEPR